MSPDFYAGNQGIYSESWNPIPASLSLKSFIMKSLLIFAYKSLSMLSISFREV
jgi:hypothetical protein